MQVLSNSLLKKETFVLWQIKTLQDSGNTKENKVYKLIAIGNQSAKAILAQYPWQNVESGVTSTGSIAANVGKRETNVYNVVVTPTSEGDQIHLNLQGDQVNTNNPL